ncbi:MAG: CusA/CzcA family heavy metal efflux RND transporter [Polyangia bacterium]|jgi:cobalt-zinc-cadmium resistance protein CzcA
MIERLVSAAVRAPFLVFMAALALVAIGIRSYTQLDIEAYPNPVAPMIEIIAQPQGWSAEEVERYVTLPLETGLVGMPGLEHVRSQSLFGLADVKFYFGWDTSYATAQQRVLNQLNFVNLPAGVQPQLSPWSAIGELYRYKVVGKDYTAADLKTAEDWILEKQFRQVPGVIDVVGFGGLTKQYHVDVDPYRLRGLNVSLAQLQAAITNANQNVGGQRLTLGEQSFDVRGIGLIRSVRDIEQIAVAAQKGVPVRVRDVAAVSVGAAPRLGVVGRDGEPDIVEGIVLMRYGGDSLSTVKGIHDRVDYIRQNRVLPPGMDIETLYDRADLVKLTTHTVMENLITGMLLVSLVLWLFLGNLRAALLVALNLPLALLFAFFGMVSTGTQANLISLGAVDFGIVVDSSVIMMESIFRNFARKGGSVFERITSAAREVGPPVFSSTLIIAVAFVPLFTLTGVAGVIMAPMAHTYAFAIGGAILLALTLTPALASRLMPTSVTQDEEEKDTRFMRVVHGFYARLFSFALQRPRWAVLLGVGPVVVALAAAGILGREFMPKLEEGNFWIRATLPTSISLEQSARYVGHIRAIVLGCPGDDPSDCPSNKRSRPEVQSVISQLGRPDDGTDVSGFQNIELLAPLRPSSEWRKGVTKASLTEEMQRDLARAFPGVVFNFSQVISDNVEEAMSGVKGENTVKVVGPDLRVDENKAGEIVAAMKDIRGVADLGIFRSLGQPAIRITPSRTAAGRYGLNTGDVAAVIQAAIGGLAITQVYEGEKHFDLTVRWAEPYRRDLRAIRAILVAAPDGAQVPLGQLADVVEENSPSVIFREGLRRYVPVKFSVRGRDLGSTIAEAQAKIAEHVKLPYDTHLEWGGEINQLRETTARLLIIIPVTLLMITFLVYGSVKNARDTLIVLLGAPVAASGGVVALFLTGSDFSISAAVGFISILGISIQDGLLVVTYARQLRSRGESAASAARQAAQRRLRPILMSTWVAMLGLLPAAVSRSIGSETQKPLAIVVIGGAVALVILPRLLQPALLSLAFRERPQPDPQV